MAITDNLTYIDYLWTKKSDDGSSIEGIRLSPLNLPTDVIYTADLPTALPNPKALTFGSKTYNGSTAQTITASDLNAVNKSGDTITGKITIQSGDPSGCLQLGADVSSNTLTANTRKLARLTFPTKEYETTKTCSIMSCDNLNGYNYVEFGGHIGDATNTAPDFLYFAVDKTHNSLSPTTKELVIAVSPTSLNLFNGNVDAGNITNFSNLSSKWVFNNSNTFKNSGYTYTLPNTTGTIALTSNIPTVNNATLTIQQNGKNVATFTANSSTNATANIIVPSKTSELNNDAGFTTNIGTITEIKVNGTSKGTSGSVNLTNMVTFASSQTANVAGVNKTTYTYNQPAGDSNTNISNGSAYFPEGIIMGGTAASAGLVTRGICGVATPDATTGACAKENLYLNYDGNDIYQSGRQVVIQAGSVGTHYGNNLYQYAAARGDAVKNYCDATYANKSDVQSKLSKKADLDSTGKVPSSQLPSYVDDVEEYTSKSSFPATGATGKIYVDTTTNLTYRWSGTAYVEISPSLALGETSSTAYAGNKGAANAKNINTILGYFDSNGNAKTALSATSAINDKDGKDITTTYVNKIVTSTESMAGSLSVAGSVTSPSIATGDTTSSYFQSRRFRGEGDAATYYHAVDFGYANHDQVDFYEYGGVWNFWKNTTAAATTDNANLCLQIGATYLKNKTNTFTWPSKSGVIALVDDLPSVPSIPTVTKQATTGISASFAGTSHTHSAPTITINSSNTATNGASNSVNVYSSITGLTAAITTSYNSANKKLTISINSYPSGFGTTEVATSAHTHTYSKVTDATASAIAASTAGGTITITDSGHTHNI